MRRETLILGLTLSCCVHGGALYALSSGLIGGDIGADRARGDEFVTALTFAPRETPATPEPEQTPEPEPKKPAVPEPVPVPQPMPATEPTPEQLLAGIDNGSKDSPNWQGFEKETPHKAPISAVEQSAMTPKVGLPVPEETELPAAPTQPAPPPTTPVEPPPEPPVAMPIAAPPVPAPEIPPPEQTPPAKEATTTTAPSPTEIQPPKPAPAKEPVKTADEAHPEPPAESTPAEEAKPAEAARPAAEPDALSERREIGDGEAEHAEPAKAPERAELPPPPGATPAREETPTPPAEQTKDSPRSAQPMPSGASVPAGAGVGEESPEESDASALKETLAVEPGKTLAREGIQIRTARPRWSTTTRVTAVPRNPFIDITFDVRGRVVKAAFASGKSTGYADVDGPLLDSIYRWRASGERFEKAVAPAGTLKLRFKMLLIEENDSQPLPIPADMGGRP